MSQKEAVIKALEMLGGKAKMDKICKLAQSLGDFSGSKSPSSTIRNCIYTNPSEFRSSGGGYWELMWYQEEIAERDKKIEELTAEVERLRKVPTEDDFVQRFIEATKTQFKFRRQKADAVRQIMDKMGRNDAEAILGAWIEGKESRPTFAINKLEIRQGGTKIYGDKNEFQDGAQLLKMGIPEGTDPAEIAERIAEKQRALLDQKENKLKE